MTIELRDARRSLVDREWLINVYPFYLHDLSGFDSSYYTLDERGLWRPDHLPSWLQEDTDHPLIIVEDDRRVGFALVNHAPSPHMQPGMDFRMSEFFVLRSERGRGIGRPAVFALFDRFRGKWEIFELPRNAPAISFWRSACGAYRAGRFAETSDASNVRQVIDTTG
jgi:predicted acetyltransferase